MNRLPANQKHQDASWCVTRIMRPYSDESHNRDSRRISGTFGGARCGGCRAKGLMKQGVKETPPLAR